MTRIKNKQVVFTNIIPAINASDRLAYRCAVKVFNSEYKSVLEESKIFVDRYVEARFPDLYKEECLEFKQLDPYSEKHCQALLQVIEQVGKLDSEDFVRYTNENHTLLGKIVFAIPFAESLLGSGMGAMLNWLYDTEMPFKNGWDKVITVGCLIATYLKAGYDVKIELLGESFLIPTIELV
ncbi:MAG: hypothetical protein WBB28_01280 [Crinalium sp.]